VWDRVDQQPSWNPNLILSEVVARLSPDGDYSAQRHGRHAGGLIKARDFVTLCVRDRRSGVQFTGGAAIETALVPPETKRFVRARISLAASPACRDVILLHSGGWIPTGIIDSAMANVIAQLGQSIQQLARKFWLKRSAQFQLRMTTNLPASRCNSFVT
uniref:START domain-containing protein n=1 Tax=Macrostomum lignano TaxID=282301 RepID=A0A1I8FM71_9PLAT